jgi:hypothetical protein
MGNEARLVRIFCSSNLTPQIRISLADRSTLGEVGREKSPEAVLKVDAHVERFCNSLRTYRGHWRPFFCFHTQKLRPCLVQAACKVMSKKKKVSDVPLSSSISPFL